MGTQDIKKLLKFFFRAIIILLFFLSHPVLFASHFTRTFDKYELRANATHKERLIQWIQSRNSPKHVGTDDPHFPSFVKFKPIFVRLPKKYLLPPEFVVKQRSLDMRSLTPQVLEKLEPCDLKILLNYLAKIPVKIKWSDQRGHTQSGKTLKYRARHFSNWEESNAAAALTLTMAVSAQTDLFVTMIALIPEAVLPELRGHMPALLDAKTTAKIMIKLLEQLNTQNTAETSRLIGHLTKQGLWYWVRKDVSKFSPYLTELFLETNKISENKNPQAKEEILGLLLGSILAGSLNHVQTIKSIDEKRIWFVGVVSNLIWAATSFIGLMPVSAPVGAIIGGTVSVGAVLSSAVYAVLKFPRDFAPYIREIEGNLELALLQAARQQNSEEKVNILMLLSWMRAAIHVNGFTD